MADKAKEKKGIWNWIDNIQGDKVIWMIVLLLIMISIIAIFSSTSMLSTSTVSRFDIFKEQLFIVALGLGIILACAISFPKYGYSGCCPNSVSPYQQECF